MADNLRAFDQTEYSRVLDAHDGHNLSYTRCVEVLLEHGASSSQAKNGAYVYCRHGSHLEVERRGNQGLYNSILDGIDGTKKTNMQCIRYLESLGYSYGQAKNAVYQYRLSRGLIR